MHTDNSRFLLEAAQRRHRDTLGRAEAAIRRLDKDGMPITFNTVAEAARVSRNWLYTTPHVRQEIERLRSKQRRGTPCGQPPANQRPSPKSKEALFELLRAKNRQLVGEVRQLKHELAEARGRICELTKTPR